jgi:glutaredoxin
MGMLINLLQNPGLAEEPTSPEADVVKMYFFWGNGCPHCEREKAFLDLLKRLHPELEIESYEVWQNRSNAGFFSRMTKSAGIKSTGVPVTFIDNKVFIGFSDKERTGIEEAVRACLSQVCIDPIERLSRDVEQEPQKTVDLPFIGKADPAQVSLPLIAIILGGLDSFNPCAFFVLFFLLSLLVHARSRPRMLVIGGTFILLSGLIYFLFMAAWLNLFLLAGRLTVITLAAGVIALTVSLINIKDFFLFKKGVSLAIPESAKPRLFEKMRNLLKASSLVSMLAGTVVLAIAANTYELLCTAGFPMVFTRVLTLHSLPPATYYLYLALYNIIYIIPLAGIVVLFTVTLGARKLTEWEGRKLKLVSGLMMLFLGLVLLLNPALLNNIFAAAGMFVSALLLSWVIISSAQRRISDGYPRH